MNFLFGWIRINLLKLVSIQTDKLGMATVAENPTKTESKSDGNSKTKYDGKDRRQFPRRDFFQGVGVLYRGEYLIAKGVEIGEGGISFQLGFVLDLNQQLVVTFRLPGYRFLSLRVEVKNSKKTAGEMQYGCAYVDVSFEVRRKIRSFVALSKSFSGSLSNNG